MLSPWGTRWPAHKGLSVGSAASFALAVLCGPSRVALALLLLIVTCGVTGWASQLWVAVSVAAVAWFSFIGSVLVGDEQLRFDHGRNLSYLGVFAVVAVAGRLAGAAATRSGRSGGKRQRAMRRRSLALPRQLVRGPVSTRHQPETGLSSRAVPVQEYRNV
jgi:hypothetical protein